MNDFFLKRQGYELLKEYDACRCEVYKVQDKYAINPVTKILKVGRFFNDKCGKIPINFFSIKSENSLLKLAKDVEGITHRINYSTHTLFEPVDMINVLEKDYIEGERLPQKTPITGTKNQTFIEHTIRNLHRQGMADFDLKPRNVVLTNTGKPYFIDLGFAKKFNTYLDRAAFQSCVDYDLEQLEQLILGKQTNMNSAAWLNDLGYGAFI